MVKQRKTDMAMTEDKYDFPFGEHHELRNRHMLVNPSEEWNEQDKHKTSTRQAQDKYRTSNDSDVPNFWKRYGIEGTSQTFGHVPHACHTGHN